MGLAVLSVSEVVQRGAAAPSDRLRTWAWWLAAVGLFAVAARIRVTTPIDQTGAGRLFVEHQLNGAAALLMLIPAVFHAREQDPVRRVFLHPGVLWLGLISYGFYIWHGPILNELDDWPSETGASAYLIRTLVAFAITAGAAAASWYLLERHAIRLGETIRGRRR